LTDADALGGTGDVLFLYQCLEGHEQVEVEVAKPPQIHAVILQQSR
jgi:hypothetical protein